ncbi:MAG: glycosyltransferase, partial [Imperialibacter sp.]
KEEREALSEADVVWAITQEDQLFFERLFFSTRSPRIVEVGYLTKINRLEPSQSQDILFVGSGNPINFHGINWFIESIWKDLKQQCPDAQLLIAGSICDEKEKIRSLSGIFFLGRLQHVEEAYAQADICINPMQMGTGLKIKSVEALSFGKVLLTTSAGATGIRHLNDSHFFCSDESGEWRKELVEILGGTKKRSMYMIKSVEIVESLNSLAKRNMALSL